MTVIRRDLIADSPQAGIVESDEFFRVLGRALAPALFSAHSCKTLSEPSAEDRRIAAHLLTQLVSRADHLATTAERELRFKHRGRVPETLSPELMRSRILDTSEAAAFCGFSVAHWRRLYRNRKVPKPVPLSTRKLGWRVGDLIDWLQSRLDSS